MEVKNIIRKENFNFQIILEEGSVYDVKHSGYFEVLISLIIKIIDNNFSYDTVNNAFEIDSCVNFMYVTYKSTVYVENIHNKKELYVAFRDEDYDHRIRFFNKSLRNTSEIAFPDFYTYFTGAYANLGVLYRTFKRFVQKMNLKFNRSQNGKIDKFIFIRNKLLIHPEDNMALADNFENSIVGMNEMDWSRSLDMGEDTGCIYHYFHKGEKYDIDLANNYLQSVEEILFEFLGILLQNGKSVIDDDEFSISEHFFDF